MRTMPKLSKAAIAALRAAADGTLGRNPHGDVTTRLGGAAVKPLHITQLADLGYITDGRTTTYRQLYTATPNGLAYLAQVDPPADTLCPGCNAPLNAQGVTASAKRAGWCSDCAPAHTLHLNLPGDFATFCGKPLRDVTADPDADSQAHDPLFGSIADINCPDCLRVLRNR